MELNESQIEIADRMASEGHTIEDIRKHLELPEYDGWFAVRARVESLQGILASISHRLTKVVDEPDTDKRREMREQLQSRIWTLYDRAHETASKTRRIREVLDG